MRTFFIYLSVALLSFPCGGFADSPTVVRTKPIRIGVVQSLTGIASEYGNTVVHGLTIARDEINSKGDVFVELLIEDDQTQPKTAVTAFQKLAASGVDAVIGATWDFTTNAIIPASAKLQTILMSTSTLNQSLNLSEGRGYAFTNGFLAEEEVRPFKQYLEKFSAKRAVLLYANNAWGETQRKIYGEIARAHGVEIVEEITTVGYDVNDWSIMIPRVRVHSPDLVLMLLNYNDLQVLLRRFKEQGVSVKVYGSPNGLEVFLKAADRENYSDICFAYPLEQLSASPAFVESYRLRSGAEPKIYADTSYDALYLLVEAIKKSRMEKIPPAEALKSTEWNGLGTRYRYSERTSFSSGRSSLVCMRDGKSTIIQ